MSIQELLPQELLGHICTYFEHLEDLKNVSLASSTLLNATKRFLYRSLVVRETIVRTRLHEIQRIGEYCRRATFELGDRPDSMANNNADRLRDTATGTHVFSALAHLPKVRHLIMKGTRKVDISPFVEHSHGFQSLTNLEISCSNTTNPLDLADYASLLKYTKNLYGLSIMPGLGNCSGPFPLTSVNLTCSVLPFSDAQSLVQACDSLEEFIFCPEDGMPDLDSVNPHQLVFLLSLRKATLQSLHIDYGLLDEEYISRPEGEMWIAGDGLAMLDNLQTLIIEYDALFGSEKFSQQHTQDIASPFLPASLGKLKILKCPPDATKLLCLEFILGHMERHSIDVTMDWFCEQEEQDMIDPDILDRVQKAQQRGSAIQMTYLGV